MAGHEEPIVGTIIQIPVGHDRHVLITTEPRPPVPRFAVTRKISADSSLLLVRVTGEVDLHTAPTLGEVLELARRDAVRLAAVTRIVADLRLVVFLGAAGLGVLERASHDCAACGIGFRVAADQLAVTRPLTITHLDRSLRLCRDPAAP